MPGNRGIISFRGFSIPLSTSVALPLNTVTFIPQIKIDRPLAGGGQTYTHRNSL